MLLYGLIVLWFAAEGHRHYRPPRIAMLAPTLVARRSWSRRRTPPSGQRLRLSSSGDDVGDEDEVYAAIRALPEAGDLRQPPGDEGPMVSASYEDPEGRPR
jgi:hypothetical protein